MNYGAFTKNKRIVFVENEVEFFNNLGLYLYFSQTSRLLDTATFTATTIPDDIYNYQIVDGTVTSCEIINEEHIAPIIVLQNDLKFIKQAAKKSSRMLLEAYGNSNLGSYITTRIKIT